MNINTQAAALVRQDVERAAMTEGERLRAAEMERMLGLLEERRITADRQLPRMEFLFRLFHKPCFPRGELVALTGKAKSGKTFASSILMALCLRNQVLSCERIEPKRLHVLWYDTEQSEESTQDILVNRIMPMAGLSAQDHADSELIDVFNVRGVGYDQRMPMLEAAVLNYRPDLVILDGIRDLVADINDGVVAQNCIERLMQLASGGRCCIVCILHQNKSAEDRNLRGWIGTELKNKAFEVYECTKSSERIFSLGQTDTRKYDIVDTLKFAVNDDGIPYLCTERQLLEAQYMAQKKVAEQWRREGSDKRLAPFNPKYVAGKQNHKTVFNVAALFKACMTPGQEYAEDELRTKVSMESNIVTDKIIREQFALAVSQGVVMQSPSALNGKRIYILRPELPSAPQQTEIVFQQP